MAGFAQLLSEDRRLVILRVLSEDQHYSANDSVLKKVLERIGHAMSRDQVRGELQWLEDQRLVTVERLSAGASPGEVWVAHLTEDGADVARGRPYPGVARPSPR